MRGKVAKKLKRFAAIHPDPATLGFIRAEWDKAPHGERGELGKWLDKRIKD